MRTSILLLVVAACGRIGIEVDAGADSRAAEAASLDGPSSERDTAVMDVVADAEPCSFAPRCASTGVEHCTARGAVVYDCPLGCVDPDDAASAHCRAVVPTHIGARGVISGDGFSFRVARDGVLAFNTTTGEIALGTTTPGSYVVVRRAGLGVIDDVAFVPISGAGATTLGVFGIGALYVDEGAGVVATGDRPLVLLVARDVRVDGTITVAADSLGPRAPGVGGGRGGSNSEDGRPAPPASMGFGAGTTRHNLAEGGGGAGFGSAGGAGGLTAVTGGALYDPPIGTMLVGGAGGAAARATGAFTDLGGGGGGAIQITANGTIFVGLLGLIDAGGAGGIGGGTEPFGGSGGGSGGAIFLEAPTVVISGVVGACGGAGGAGGAAGGAGGNGARGDPRLVPARGGTNAASSAGAGGDGSCASTTPGAAGVAGVGATPTGGGGGGGAGRIHIRTMTGAETFSVGVVPRPTVGTVTISD